MRRSDPITVCTNTRQRRQSTASRRGGLFKAGGRRERRLICRIGREERKFRDGADPDGFRDWTRPRRRSRTVMVPGSKVTRDGR